MNWVAVGAIGELIGGAAVIATLIYLAVQLRPWLQTFRLIAHRYGEDLVHVTARTANLIKGKIED